MPKDKPTPQPVQAVQQVTLLGLIMNVFLMGVKFVAGVLGHSQALVADAMHTLSDLVTDVAVLVGARYWSAPPDQNHPHGHGRIETMVTFFIGGALVATGLGLAYGAIRALHTPPALQISGWVGVAALLSVFVKEGMFQWTMRVAQRTGSMALVANAWHHRSDALSSVPVFIAVVAVHFEPSWGFLDPVGALIVSAFILRAAWDIFLPAMQQLMDEGASVDMQQRIIDLVRGTEGVCSMHKLRTRYIGHTLHVDLHIQVDPQLSVYAGHAIAHHVKDRVMAALVDVADVLIHVEPYDPARH